MFVTILLSFVMMSGLFLMLFSGVALIQDKKFFSSAPKEVQAAVKPRKERFKGAHALGWFLIVLALALMAGPLFFAGFNGIHNGYGFWKLFVRFISMLILLKVFDVLFFDWFLLCRSGFFSHFYPEVKDVLGPQLFGYNKKTHLLHLAAFPFAAAAMAGISLLFKFLQ